MKWITLLLFVFPITNILNLHAETKPRWVPNGVKELDKKRSNTTYSFHIFHLQDEKNRSFKYDSYTSLINYVDTAYQVANKDVIITPIETEDNEKEPETFKINFIKDNQPIEIYARKVDSYINFEDFPDGSFDYNVWQLFAISAPNIYPEFDDFILKTRYSLAPMAMSIIPGLGQIYKGQKTKGYIIMGIEAAMIGSIIFATSEMHRNRNLAQGSPQADSFLSKADSFKALRTFSLITGGALYVYNLLDAALSKGARYVKIERKNEPDLRVALLPSFTMGAPGLTLGIRF